MKYNQKIFAVATLILLSGCSGGSAINSHCSIANPIYVSKSDTLTGVTARQVLDHNEVGEKICDWKPAK